MGDRNVCDENYGEPGARHATGGQLTAVHTLRRALVRLIWGEMWEGRAAERTTG